MSRSERPNVIVIVSDTYRPDHIAANGHPDVYHARARRLAGQKRDV